MRHLFFFLLLLTVLNARAQEQYAIEKSIHYYPDSITQKDTYIASQCTLDMYYPKGAKNFATIVWFHGGGITGGTKEIQKSFDG